MNRVLRLARSSVGSSEGEIETHRSRRNSRAVRSIRAGLIAKGVQIASRLVSVPISIRVLGTYQYGLWLTAGSMLNWLGLSSLGFSTGMVNAISHADGLDDRRSIREHISTGTLFFTAVGSLMFLAVIVLSSWPGLDRLLGIQNHRENLRAVREVILITGLCFAITTPLGIAGTACSALQENYLASFSFALNALAGLAVLLVIAWIGHCTLPAFATASTVPSLVAGVAFALYYFGHHRPDLRPGLSFVSWRSLRGIGGPSLYVFVSQIGDMAVLYSSNVVISSHLGPAAVPQYSILYSIFMLGASVANDFLQPIWPAYTEAVARRDKSWVASAFLRSLALCLGIMLLLGLGMLIAGRTIIRFWAGPAAVPPLALIGAMAIYFLASTVSLGVDTLIRGLGLFKERALVVGGLGIAFVTLSVITFPRFGIFAPPIVGTLTSGLTAIALGWIVKNELAQRFTSQGPLEDRPVPAGANV